MLEVFKLILSLKEIKPQELIITDSDEYIMEQFYKIVADICDYKAFRNSIISYQIDSMNIDTYECCDIIVEAIKKKYIKKLIK